MHLPSNFRRIYLHLFDAIREENIFLHRYFWDPWRKRNWVVFQDLQHLIKKSVLWCPKHDIHLLIREIQQDQDRGDSCWDWRSPNTLSWWGVLSLATSRVWLPLTIVTLCDADIRIWTNICCSSGGSDPSYYAMPACVRHQSNTVGLSHSRVSHESIQSISSLPLPSSFSTPSCLPASYAIIQFITYGHNDRAYQS